MRKINKFLFWTPRVLAIVFILFLAMFSLDIFDMKLDFWGTMLGLFMHNIPVFILIIILIISWKHELVGAIAFILGGLLYFIRTLVTAFMNPFEWQILLSPLIIGGPAFLVGILFYLNWKAKKKR